MPEKNRHSQNRRIVAITMGDPGGIGPEVTLKALASREVQKRARQKGRHVFFVLLGNVSVFEHNKRLIRSRLSFNIIPSLNPSILSSQKINILDLGDDAGEIEIGKVSFPNAVLAFHALEVGAYLATHRVVHALVTAPINKEAIRLLSPSFTGHTEYLARIAKVKQFAMLLQGGPLRVVLVTTHLPLHKVSTAITINEIVIKIKLTHSFLKEKVKIRNPVIGVAAFNPHAGEGGNIGREEIATIIPAIQRARQKGIKVVGPLPADIIFYYALRREFDAVIAMYHDQGLGPLKMIAFESGVNITLNLPFIRTSPDHGTAFDIAYKNKANPQSMIEAIKTALDLVSP